VVGSTLWEEVSEQLPDHYVWGGVWSRAYMLLGLRG
jgi:hypothetical protein